MAKRKVTGSDNIVVEEVKAGPSRPFWETYQTQILYGLGIIAVLIGAYWLYKTLVVAPKQQEAVTAMWQAEQQFGRDSFQMALLNPGGGFDGFEAIADKYSGTPAGNSAKYYAGVCYLQMGDFDNAIKFLESYDPEGDMLPAMKYGALGDCYSEKQDFNKALSLYEKAANSTSNELIAGYYLKKLGMLNEKEGKHEAAAAAYERIRRDFPNQQSADWREIEKYIYRAKAAAGK
jgi:tetratricopeptide (TPR) repeat protein